MARDNTSLVVDFFVHECCSFVESRDFADEGDGDCDCKEKSCDEYFSSGVNDSSAQNEHAAKDVPMGVYPPAFAKHKFHDEQSVPGYK